MKTAELRMIPVDQLKPAEYNPRKKLKPGDAEYEKIKASISEFGFADPLVVNADMTIIGGHQRLTVATDLGYTEVPCAVVDVDKTREKALNIALNKIIHWISRGWSPAPYHGSRAMRRSPSPLAWRPDFPGAPREAH